MSREEALKLIDKELLKNKNIDEIAKIVGIDQGSLYKVLTDSYKIKGGADERRTLAKIISKLGFKNTKIVPVHKDNLKEFSSQNLEILSIENIENDIAQVKISY